MLPVALTAQVATTPGQTLGISAFNQSFRDGLNINHSQLSGAYMIATFLASLPIFFIGALMDRYGIRRVMTVVVICLGGACFFIARAHSLVTLFMAFCLLRVFGHGALPLLADNTLAMWFRKRLGTVSGLKNLGITCTVMSVPPLFLWLIHTFGWREAFAILGLGVWALMLPLLLLVFRNRPEEIGQVIDGMRNVPPCQSPDASTEPPTTASVSLDLKAAARTRAFWILLAQHGIWGLMWAGVIFNITPLFQSRGLTDNQAAATFVTLGLCMALMQLIGGFMADRLPLNLLLAAAVAAKAVGLIFLLSMNRVWTAHAYAAVFGVGQGLAAVVGSTIWARYFGRDHLGKIRACAQTATVAASSLGPFLMAAAYDQFQSFVPPLLLFLALTPPLVVALLFATPPQRVKRKRMSNVQ